MKKITILLSLSFLFYACKTEQKDASTNENNTASANKKETTVPTDNGNGITTVEPVAFDWTNIPVSTVEIGTFPYIQQLPEEFTVVDESGLPAKNGLTKSYNHNKLISYDGNNFFETIGKRGDMRIYMKDKQVDFNEFSINEFIEKHLKNIGATQIFYGEIPVEKLDELNKNDKNISFNYIIGDHRNSPIKIYALNHKNGKIIFQVVSNSASAEIGVVESID